MEGGCDLEMAQGGSGGGGAMSEGIIAEIEETFEELKDDIRGILEELDRLWDQVAELRKRVDYLELDVWKMKR